MCAKNYENQLTRQIMSEDKTSPLLRHGVPDLRHISLMVIKMSSLRTPILKVLLSHSYKRSKNVETNFHSFPLFPFP